MKMRMAFALFITLQTGFAMASEKRTEALAEFESVHRERAGIALGGGLQAFQLDTRSADLKGLSPQLAMTYAFSGSLALGVQVTQAIQTEALESPLFTSVRLGLRYFPFGRANRQKISFGLDSLHGREAIIKSQFGPSGLYLYPKMLQTWYSFSEADLSMSGYGIGTGWCLNFEAAFGTLSGVSLCTELSVYRSQAASLLVRQMEWTVAEILIQPDVLWNELIMHN